jgi:hypothetical protein
LEDRAIAPQRRAQVPLPESSFVAEARHSIPVASTRVITASTRGNLRGRGRGRGRGRSTATTATRNTSTATDTAAGNKRTAAAAGASSSSRPPPRRRNYNTGPGTAHYLLFGDDEQRGQADGEGIPDLNAPVPGEEIPVSQNAPQ